MAARRPRGDDTVVTEDVDRPVQGSCQKYGDRDGNVAIVFQHVIR